MCTERSREVKARNRTSKSGGIREHMRMAPGRPWSQDMPHWGWRKKWSDPGRDGQFQSVVVRKEVCAGILIRVGLCRL